MNYNANMTIRLYQCAVCNAPPTHTYRAWIGKFIVRQLRSKFGDIFVFEQSLVFIALIVRWFLDMSPPGCGNIVLDTQSRGCSHVDDRLCIIIIIVVVVVVVVLQLSLTREFRLTRSPTTLQEMSHVR